VLHSDKRADRLPTIRVLHALEILGPALSDYRTLIVPPLVDMFYFLSKQVVPVY
jgi:hypothetical protein